MTTAADLPVATVLRRAAERAVLAPSVHNTQPWTFVLRRDSLEIHADPSRQLTVLDPRGRQLMISLGCALFHARVAIAASGHDARRRALSGVQAAPASWPGCRSAAVCGCPSLRSIR